jgi:hypothetical protein
MLLVSPDPVELLNQMATSQAPVDAKWIGEK